MSSTIQSYAWYIMYAICKTLIKPIAHFISNIETHIVIWEIDNLITQMVTGLLDKDASDEIATGSEMQTCLFDIYV